MYIEYQHKQNKEILKDQIDKYVAKLNKLEFSSNFKISELHRSWSNHEMMCSLMIKQGFLERRIKALIQVKDDVIIIEFGVPDVVKNFIREEKLEYLITKHLDNVLDETSYLSMKQNIIQE